MHTVTVTVAPITSRPGYYTARADGRLLCRSRQPLLDGARELLAAGYPTETTLVMKHAGSGVEALRTTIGSAARLTVETDEQGRPIFRQWRGPRTRGPAPPADYLRNSDPRDLAPPLTQRRRLRHEPPPPH